MMWKKIVVIAGLSVAALGVGGVALAATSSSAPAAAPAAAVAASTSSGTSSTAPKAAHKGEHKGKRDKADRLLKSAAHAQWVSKDGKTGAWVTHDAVRGSVTAVSSTSITVKAADSTSETFTVNATTKVHAKGDSKAHPGTIAQVKVGDEVGVLGTGSGTMTATHVLDRGVPKK